ncbi:hypothetical protein EW145_g7256 [Phellinidium pouzarii]|uniref:FAD-binding domain-containing protein n=1 Tax=Phellinidium pouzarii TaxID=167371 RepID=A0A4S4KLY0_9AGAM|nr:hypothetical protein EW145_g7256 [Phellinidium pouzarii]
MQTTPRINLAISGGGIGGLTLAVVLNKYCNDVHIDLYESASQFTQIGAGVSVWKRAWFIMQSLGLDISLGKMAVQPPVDDPNGAISLHRVDILKVLTDNLPPSQAFQAHFSKRLISYEQGPDSVTLLFSDGASTQADVLVGADGIKSATRMTMYKKLTTSAEEHGMDKAGDLRKFVQASWTGMYAYRALIKTESLLRENPGHQAASTPLIYFGKHKRIISFPISQGRLVNFIAYVTGPGRDGNELGGPSVTDVTKQEMIDHYQGWEPEVQALLNCVDKPSKWAISHLQGLPCYVDGRVALLGDSAHAITPHLGAGAGQAIEVNILRNKQLRACLLAHYDGLKDAFVLGQLLAQLLVTRTNLSFALKVYDAVRRPLGNAMVDRSREAGYLYEFSELPESIDELKWEVHWSALPDVEWKAAAEMLRDVVSSAVGFGSFVWSRHHCNGQQRLSDIHEPVSTVGKNSARASVEPFSTSRVKLFPIIDKPSEILIPSIDNLSGDSAHKSGAAQAESVLATRGCYKTIERWLPTFSYPSLVYLADLSYNTLDYTGSKAQEVSAELSRMQTLMPDVLVHIFTHCIDIDYLPRSLQMKLEITIQTLAAVCKHWRNVAYSNPLLWSRITLLGISESNAAMLNLCLKRSLDVPLGIKVWLTDPSGPLQGNQETEDSEPTLFERVFGSMVAHQSRWRLFVLDYGSVTHSPSRTSRWLLDDLPLVETLGLRTATTSHSGLPSFQVDLSKSHRLNALSLHGDIQLRHSLPLSHLTYIQLDHTHPSERFPTVSDCVALMAKTPNLRNIRVYPSSPAVPAPPGTFTHVVIPSLLVLQVGAHGERGVIGAFLAQVTLPALRELHIVNDAVCVRWPDEVARSRLHPYGLPEFLQRSRAPLQIFSIHSLIEYEPHLVNALAYMPVLRDLTFSYCCTLSNRIFEALMFTQPGGSAPQLCPALERISFRRSRFGRLWFDTEFTDERVLESAVKMIVSRWRSVVPVRTLRMFKAKCCRLSQLQQYPLIAQCVSEGLVMEYEEEMLDVKKHRR